MNLAANRQQTITSGQMQWLLEKLHQYAGIRIESPQSIVEFEIAQRMDALELGSVGDYLELLESGFNAKAEWLALIDLLTVKETRFFRQPAAFEVVKKFTAQLVAAGKPVEPISFWSAGSSTGQELYSLAMTVAAQLKQQKSDCAWSGIGTDISFRAIQTAGAGSYSNLAAESIPACYRDVYVEPGQQSECRIVQSIRTGIEFFQCNLLHVNTAPLSDFSIVFCQNVLIYFERDRRHWIIEQLVHRLRPGGLLILGAGEDALWHNPQMRRLETPGVCAYYKAMEV